MNYEKRKAFIVNCVYAGLIACICYVVLRYGLGLLAPFLLAALFAYMLKIPADFLCRKTGLPYKPTVFLLVLLFYSTIGLLLSLAGFYLGTAFIDLFAVRLGWISVSGNSGFARYFPVALCLSVLGICFYGQMLAASLEREMEQDYAMYLRCRGLQDGRILLFHAFPHAVVDLLPSFAQMLGLCLANAAIVERVFSLSGLGYLIIDAVVKRDSPVIHAAVLVLALTLVLLDTVAELLQYALRSDMRAAGGRA